MKAPKLAISLAESRPFGPREVMRGTATVSCEQAVFCDRLVLVLVLETQGQGNSMRYGAKEIEIYSGRLESGEHDFEFELPAPKFPPTYQGTLFSSRWLLEARGAFFDPVGVDQPMIEVEGGSSEFELQVPDDAKVALTATKPGHPKAVHAVSSATVVILAIAIAAAAAAVVAGIVFMSWVLILVAGLHGLLFTFAGVAAARHHRRAKVIGNPQLDIDRITARFEAREIVETGTRSTDTFERKTHDLWSQSLTLHQEKPGQWEGDVDLPANGPYLYSFAGGSGNFVDWRAVVEVVLDGGDADESSFGLTVKPRG